MPLDFHSDLSQKFRQQYLNTKSSTIPFIESVTSINNKRIMEIGCGEGGILKAFTDIGCSCLGIDLSISKIEYANKVMKDEISNGAITFISDDIYNLVNNGQYYGQFDLVILKDTIEHIYNKKKLLLMIKNFLNSRGMVFIAFPPWNSPYGGHQQMANTKFGKLPYYHLLPRSFYKWLLKLFGESEQKVQGLIDHINTRMSIKNFEKLLVSCDYIQIKKELYLINPIYEFKFGLKPIKQLPVIRSINWFRDFVSTTCYYLVRDNNSLDFSKNINHSKILSH